MEIIRNAAKTEPGSDEHFTGTTYIDLFAQPTEESHVLAGFVHFAPGARTNWHAHPHGQTIYVTAGTGRCQRRGGPVETIQPGDIVFFAPGEDHWHGASPDRFMTHIGVSQIDPNGPGGTAGAPVTDDEYGAGAPLT